MILGKMWHAFRAQMNKLANWFSGKDPVAQLQYEYDRSVDQLKEGREGLAQYRALVERVTKQVDDNQRQISVLEAKIKAYLKANDRDTAAQLALQLQKAKQAMGENQSQLALHEQAYNNHLTKIKHATKKLADLQDRIHKYDAELKMSKAEAEMAELAKSFNFDVSTDFGQVENIIENKIALNRGKARVAADLSGEGVEDVKREIAVENAMAEQALEDFEKEAGIAPQVAAPVAQKSLQ
jgi:phage shock protein A